MFIYAMIYYVVIPVSIQEAPIHFKLQKAPEVLPQTNLLMFTPQPALACHLPIESALTEYQRIATQAYDAALNESHADTMTDDNASAT